MKINYPNLKEVSKRIALFIFCVAIGWYMKGRLSPSGQMAGYGMGEVYILAQKAQNKIATKCEEIASFGRYHVFRGVANLQKEYSAGSLGFASIGGNASNMAGLLGDMTATDRHLTMGDEYFRIQGFKGLDGIIENGDEIVISCHKSKGTWISFNYGNISRRYIKTRSVAFIFMVSFLFFSVGSILFTLFGGMLGGTTGAGIGFFIAIVCSLWYFKKAYNEKQANNYIKKICNC